MNWKNEAMEKLRRFDPMCRAVHNLPLEIRRLQIAASSLKGARTDAPVTSGDVGRREELLMENLVHRQELQQRLEQARCWLDMTQRALESLEPAEQLILQRLYIRPEKDALTRLRQELGVEQSTVYRRRDEALRRFTLALYGTVDS